MAMHAPFQVANTEQFQHHQYSYKVLPVIK